MYYILMIRLKLHYRTRLTVENILGYIERTVTPYGTGAKVSCPKEYMGKKVLLIILKE